MSETQQAFEGAWQAAGPDESLECGICWWVYDPQEGDATRQIPPGTAFLTLPDDWCCPGCDAPRHKFMRR